MMRVAVNGRFTSQRLTGVQRHGRDHSSARVAGCGDCSTRQFQWDADTCGSDVAGSRGTASVVVSLRHGAPVGAASGHHSP